MREAGDGPIFPLLQGHSHNYAVLCRPIVQVLQCQIYELNAILGMRVKENSAFKGWYSLFH